MRPDNRNWPRGDTPASIRDKIAVDVRKVLDSPELKERFRTAGFNAQPMTPTEFNGFVEAERAKFGRIIQTLKLPKE